MRTVIFIFLLILSGTFVHAQQVVSGTSVPLQVNISRANYDNGIPVLSAKAEFSEPSGNNLLDAGETATLKITVTNSGSNAAYDVAVSAVADNAQNLNFSFDNSFLGEIAPGKSAVAVLSFTANESIQNESRKFTVSFSEHNGFIARPVEFSFNTQKFLEPKLVFIEAGIEEFMGGSKPKVIELGELILATVLIQNQGQGIAENVQYEITGFTSDLIKTKTDDYPVSGTLGSMQPGESKKIHFAFSATYNYVGSENLPLNVILSESKKRYGINENLKLQLNKQQLLAVDMKAQGAYSQEVKIDTASLSSDVDKNIPLNGKTSHPRYALIVGCEDYSESQTGANVPFATNDALVFKEYCVNTLGIPKENIILLVGNDASKTKIIVGLRALTNYSKIQENEELFFYYSGHGLPDEITKESYIIPTDVSGTSPADGIMLSAIYDSLTRYNPLRATAIIDACFSGAGKDKELVAMKTGRIPPKQSNTTGNLVIFSASSGIEKANPYIEKQHGLLTYLFLKKLQETKGSITYAEMAEYLKKEAALISNGLGSMQTPQLIYNPSLGDSWKTWKFFE